MHGSCTKKSRVGALACLLLAHGALAQTARPMLFDRLGLQEGLAQLAANAIAQDATGYIWVGTEEGLDRYDGYAFEHFRRDRTLPHSLTNDFIGDIEVDRHGQLWIATDGGGIVRHDAATGRFIGVVPREGGLERVRALEFARDGRLWIATRDAGLAVLEPATGRLTRFRHGSNARSLRHDSTFAVLEDRAGLIWVGTESGLDQLGARSTQFERLNIHSRVRALLQDSQGFIWVGTAAGLARIAPGTGGTTWFTNDERNPASLPAGEVNALLEDRYRRLWIGTDTGLALLDRERSSFTTYSRDPTNPKSLPDNQIMSLHEDRSGLLWVGTKFGGVAKWNPRTWSFGHRMGLNVMAFTEDSTRRLWVGSIGGGLTIIERGSGATRQVAGLSDDRVMALLTDRDGAIWAGTMGGGLHRIDPRTLRIQVYRHDPADPSTLGAPGVMSMLEDSTGRIWIGTYGGGLSLYQTKSGSFRRYESAAADPRSLESGRVTALAEDSNQTLLVGTDGGGLHVLYPERNEFFRLSHREQDAGALSSDTVYAIHVDSGGAVWVGTRGGGLSQMLGSTRTPGTIRFRSYTERDGLPYNTVYGIRSDAAGGLWLSTNRGLARFDPKTGRVRAFHLEQGLQGEEFNFGAHYATRDGRLLFGGPNGYNELDPSGIEFNAVAPPVVLAAVARKGSRHLGPLRLDARDSAVTFEFAALDFASPEANWFQYRLDGLDRSWSAPTHDRRVSYTNLDGGRYSLLVRGANADGVWSQKVVSVPLEVAPPPWKTLWAYALYALAFLMLCWLAWAAHQRSMAREKRYSQNLEAEVRRRTVDLERLSLSDALTGLGNRRALVQAMPEVTRTGQRFAFYVIDLDNLKPINDSYGHGSGDRVLAGVAELLREDLRESDRVVRWGGDEFVLVRSIDGLDDAADYIERLRVKIARRRFDLSNGDTAQTTCSIGFALFPFVAAEPGFLSWEQVLNLADIALYRAKAKRNAWVGWSGRLGAVHAPDLTTLLTAEPDSETQKNYVECRSSLRAEMPQEDLAHA